MSFCQKDRAPPRSLRGALPVPSWAEEVPKVDASDVGVAVVPDIALVPAGAVFQPCLGSFVVGSAQVPPAVPMPAVETLLSQK